MECKYCGTLLKSKYSLAKHQLTSKYCLSKRNKLSYVCEFCNKTFKTNKDLTKHIIICEIKKQKDELLSTIKELLDKILQLETKNKYLQDTIKELYSEKNNDILDNVSQPYDPTKVAKIFWQEYNKHRLS